MKEDTKKRSLITVWCCALTGALALCGCASVPGVIVKRAGQAPVTVTGADQANLLPGAVEEFSVSPLDVVRVEVWQSSESGGPFRLETYNAVRISFAFDEKDWIKVRAGTSEGWVRSTAVSRGAGDYRMMQVGASLLNVRERPDGAIIGRIERGTPVFVKGSNNSWTEIAYGSGSAWVSTQHLQDCRDRAPGSRRLSVKTALHDMPHGSVIAELQPGTIVECLEGSFGYHIMVGDWLRINFRSDPQLDFEITVRPDGRITLPRIGEVMSAGLKPEALALKISEAYKNQIKSPETTVTIVQANTTMLESINGEYTVRPDGHISVPILGEVSAADITPRELADRLSHKASSWFYNCISASVVITDFIPRNLLQFDRTVTVLPDGTLILPEAGIIQAAGITLSALRDAIRQALETRYNNKVDVSLTLLESANRTVYVSGEVFSAGSYPLTNNMTMLKAIMQAGGVTTEGNIADVVLIHYEKAGDVTIYQTDLAQVIKNNLALNDLTLSPQDIIFVPRTGISQANLFIEQYIDKMLPFSRGVSYNYNKNRNSDISQQPYTPTQ